MSAAIVLAEDARDRDGRLLLPRGAAIDDARLAELRRRGAEAVLVMEADTSHAAPFDADAIGARVDKLFRRSADDEATRALREYVLRYRLGSTQ